jgi:hypothetical protein
MLIRLFIPTSFPAPSKLDEDHHAHRTSSLQSTRMSLSPQLVQSVSDRDLTRSTLFRLEYGNSIY